MELQQPKVVAPVAPRGVEIAAVKLAPGVEA
jgi:hypothetical protein